MTQSGRSWVFGEGGEGRSLRRQVVFSAASLLLLTGILLCCASGTQANVGSSIKRTFKKGWYDVTNSTFARSIKYGARRIGGSSRIPDNWSEELPSKLQTIHNKSKELSIALEDVSSDYFYVAKKAPFVRKLLKVALAEVEQCEKHFESCHTIYQSLKWAEKKEVSANERETLVVSLLRRYNMGMACYLNGMKKAIEMDGKGDHFGLAGIGDGAAMHVAKHILPQLKKMEKGSHRVRIEKMSLWDKILLIEGVLTDMQNRVSAPARMLAFTPRRKRRAPPQWLVIVLTNLEAMEADRCEIKRAFSSGPVRQVVNALSSFASSRSGKTISQWYSKRETYEKDPLMREKYNYSEPVIQMFFSMYADLRLKIDAEYSKLKEKEAQEKAEKEVQEKAEKEVQEKEESGADEKSVEERKEGTSSGMKNQKNILKERALRKVEPEQALLEGEKSDCRGENKTAASEQNEEGQPEKEVDVQGKGRKVNSGEAAGEVNETRESQSVVKLEGPSGQSRADGTGQKGSQGEAADGKAALVGNADSSFTDSGGSGSDASKDEQGRKKGLLRGSPDEKEATETLGNREMGSEEEGSETQAVSHAERTENDEEQTTKRQTSAVETSEKGKPQGESDKKGTVERVLMEVETAQGKSGQEETSSGVSDRPRGEGNTEHIEERAESVRREEEEAAQQGSRKNDTEDMRGKAIGVVNGNEPNNNPTVTPETKPVEQKKATPEEKILVKDDQETFTSAHGVPKDTNYTDVVYRVDVSLSPAAAARVADMFGNAVRWYGATLGRMLIQIKKEGGDNEVMNRVMKGVYSLMNHDAIYFVRSASPIMLTLVDKCVKSHNPNELKDVFSSIWKLKESSDAVASALHFLNKQLPRQEL